MDMTVKIERILYATDLSENARFAAAYAISQASLYGAKIIFLHVLPEVSELLDKNVIGYIDENQWQAIKQSHYQDAKEALIGKRKEYVVVREVLDQFSRNARAERGDREIPEDEILVENGNPVEVILRVVKEKSCDLIVMGTHGRGTLADAMMGSTARRVIRRSVKPVLVVRLPEGKEDQR
ncbi:MAG: universal stress protein [Deltaproteobacteria bacterium]|nr:universal stress protein [Deltaproteobacteria bacterium]